MLSKSNNFLRKSQNEAVEALLNQEEVHKRRKFSEMGFKSEKRVNNNAGSLRHILLDQEK